jgi:hypothetical protein
VQARRTVAEDARDVIALALSREIRAPVVIAFASFAAVLGVRGLWGGPWLMEVKGLARVPRPADIAAFVRAQVYDPSYPA